VLLASLGQHGLAMSKEKDITMANQPAHTAFDKIAIIETEQQASSAIPTISPANNKS
jgi:hypothetical protein